MGWCWSNGIESCRVARVRTYAYPPNVAGSHTRARTITFVRMPIVEVLLTRPNKWHNKWMRNQTSRDQKIFCGVVGDDDGGSLTVRGSSAVVKKPESPMTATWLVKKDFIIMSSFSDEVDWASTPNFCPPDWTETKKCPGGARRFLVEFRSRVRPGSSRLTTAHSATHFYYFSLCTMWLTLFHSRSQWITFARQNAVVLIIANPESSRFAMSSPRYVKGLFLPTRNLWHHPNFFFGELDHS